MQSALPTLMHAIRVTRQTRQRVRKSWEGVDQLRAIEAITVERTAATRTMLGLPVLQNGNRSSTRSRLLMLQATASIRDSDSLALLLRRCLAHLAKRSSAVEA
jgi:hypothetical protein